MFINPKVAIEKGWIKGITDQAKQVQPNAVDFTLDKVWTIDQSTAVITEQSKTMRQVTPCETYHSEVWMLHGQKVYDCMSDMYVEVPEGVAAILYTRSTFARNGIFIVSGLYDSGFKGNIGFTMYTIGGPVHIAPGTRIGQIAFVSAENAGMYAGGYNHEAGTHWKKPEQPSLAKQLEQANRLDGDAGGKVAGTKSFL